MKEEKIICETCGDSGRVQYSCCGDNITTNEDDICPGCGEHCGNETEECPNCNG